jgi:hypothetical protein
MKRKVALGFGLIIFAITLVLIWMAWPKPCGLRKGMTWHEIRDVIDYDGPDDSPIDGTPAGNSVILYVNSRPDKQGRITVYELEFGSGEPRTLQNWKADPRTPFQWDNWLQDLRDRIGF